MPAEEERPDRPAEASAVAQFSLRSIFVVTTVAAIVLTLLFQVPDPLAVPVLLFATIAFPAVLVTILIYGSGYQRTFSIGALFPLTILLLLLVFAQSGVFASSALTLPFDEPVLFRTSVGAFWLSSVVIGLLCVATRWELERDRARARQAVSERRDEPQG